jgi:hypothetical protein
VTVFFSTGRQLFLDSTVVDWQHSHPCSTQHLIFEPEMKRISYRLHSDPRATAFAAAGERIVSGSVTTG